MNIQVVLNQLSTEDKIRLCSGKDFWHLESFPDLGIPEINVSDGPHGLRKQLENSDQLGLSDSIAATCFPTASLSACSWDKELLYKLGQIIGEEAIQQKVSVLLGPGVNIKRHPLCGRNFEYFSEDPLLGGLLASSFIQGVQSQGIGTSLKHFAGNNQECERMSSSSNIDQRALREIYLKPFELAVKQAQPWSVMCSYNKLNGIYSSSNPRLLTQVLRHEWGFKGLVISDWGAAHQRSVDLQAGLDLEMPGNHQFYLNQVKLALANKTLKMEDVDRSALNVLDLINKSCPALRRQVTIDIQSHRDFARKLAQESIVLLTNKNHFLPLDPLKKIVVIGELAQKARYQGSGSSQVHPYQIESLLDGLNASAISYDYKQGYTLKDKKNLSYIPAAIEGITANQSVVVFVGLTDEDESEGFDRTDLSLPEAHNALIDAVLEKTSQVIVILAGGAPVEMHWVHRVAAILNGYLPGEAGGPALVDILFGKVNPSGKLAETYPISMASLPSSASYGKEHQQINYRESIFVGYRYFDSAKAEVLFPFGHGLSYTTFDYRNLSYAENVLSFTLTNTGAQTGSEIVQVYLSNRTQVNFFASHELKAFEKVTLKAQESRVIHIALDTSAFEYYDSSYQRFVCAAGEYELQVGASSRDLRLRKIILLKTQQTQHIEKAWHKSWYDHLQGQPTDQDFKLIYEHDILNDNPFRKGSFTLDSTLNEMQSTWAGKLMKVVSKRMLMKSGHYTKIDTESNHFKMMMAFVLSTPLRTTMLMSQGALSQSMATGIVELANGHYGTGLKILFNKNKV